MDKKKWNNDFLTRCTWPRELFVDGMRLHITDERHAAYWDDHGHVVRLADTDERHALELDLLPDAEQFADFDNVVGDVFDGEPVDLASMRQADAIDAVNACDDADTLRGWMLATNNNQLKGAIRRRLAEVT